MGTVVVVAVPFVAFFVVVFGSIFAVDFVLVVDFILVVLVWAVVLVGIPPQLLLVYGDVGVVFVLFSCEVVVLLSSVLAPSASRVTVVVSTVVSVVEISVTEGKEISLSAVFASPQPPIPSKKTIVKRNALILFILSHPFC